ncbi:unnamed protein product [Rotaria sp. Silwood2]|nr:unnamed protein product [Rotaria sp. Silwood2]
MLSITVGTSSTTSTSTTSSSSTSTTSSTSTSTTDTTSSSSITTCSGGNSLTSGALASQSGTSPSFWTGYNYTYVAMSTSPILIFSFATDLNNNYFLDDVSVTLATAPSNQLLNNPSFEDSITILNGWVVWCDYTYTAGAGAQVTWGTNCYVSMGNCFLVDCPDTGSGAIVYLG